MQGLSFQCPCEFRELSSYYILTLIALHFLLNLYPSRLWWVMPCGSFQVQCQQVEPMCQVQAEMMFQYITIWMPVLVLCFLWVSSSFWHWAVTGSVLWWYEVKILGRHLDDSCCTHTSLCKNQVVNFIAAYYFLCQSQNHDLSEFSEVE